MVRLWFSYVDDSTIADAEVFGATVMVEVSEQSTTIPVVLESGGLSSADGSESTGGTRMRNDFIPLQNVAVSVDSSLRYYIYYYNADKEYISNNGSWLADPTDLMDSAPAGTAYIRFIIKNTDNASMATTQTGLYSAKVTLTILGGTATASETEGSSDVITLTDLVYGSYKARLTDGTNHSDWCYWMVVDATSSVATTGTAGEIDVDFHASNATPIFVAWCNGTSNGTEHISVLTDEDVENGVAICNYKAGSYKLRVAFQTEYGIVHSALSKAITV
jgi:hypothetical protein